MRHCMPPRTRDAIGSPSAGCSRSVAPGLRGAADTMAASDSYSWVPNETHRRSADLGRTGDGGRALAARSIHRRPVNPSVSGSGTAAGGRRGVFTPRARKVAGAPEYVHGRSDPCHVRVSRAVQPGDGACRDAVFLPGAGNGGSAAHHPRIGQQTIGQPDRFAGPVNRSTPGSEVVDRRDARHDRFGRQPGPGAGGVPAFLRRDQSSHRRVRGEDGGVDRGQRRRRRQLPGHARSGGPHHVDAGRRQRHHQTDGPAGIERGHRGGAGGRGGPGLRRGCRRGSKIGGAHWRLQHRNPPGARRHAGVFAGRRRAGGAGHPDRLERRGELEGDPS